MFELSRASSIILATAVSAVLAGQILWTARRWRVGDFRSVESEYWRTSNLVIRAFIRLTYVDLVVFCTTVVLGTAALWRIYYGPLPRWIAGAIVIVTTVIYVSGWVLMVTITLWNWPRPLVPRPFRGERGLLG